MAELTTIVKARMFDEFVKRVKELGDDATVGDAREILAEMQKEVDGLAEIENWGEPKKTENNEKES